MRYALLLALLVTAVSCTRTKNISVNPSTATALNEADARDVLLALGLVAFGAIAFTLAKGPPNR